MSYTTKPVIDSIIHKLKKLKVKPINNGSIMEIEQLLHDKQIELRRIGCMLYDYTRLTEIQDRILEKQKEIDFIYKSLLDDEDGFSDESCESNDSSNL